MKYTIQTSLKIVLFVVVFCTVAVAAHITNGGWDWIHSYRPYSILALSGKDPYAIILPESGGFFNPPWILLLTIPLALLPGTAGGILLALLNAAGFAAAVRSTGGDWRIMLITLISPLVLLSVQGGNIDGLSLFGLVLPPQIGLFFILLKPQVGVCVALFWLVEAWRRGKAREVLRVFAPVSIALMLSFVAFGLYPLHSSNVIEQTWNYSMFPYSIPVGAFLLFYALRTGQVQLSIASGLMFSPYVGYWGTAVLAFSPRPRATLIMFLASWAALLIALLVFLR